jgi:hypothetical protein
MEKIYNAPQTLTKPTVLTNMMLLLKHYNHSNVTFPRSQWGLIRFQVLLVFTWSRFSG